ncbi:SDR family NAD(P)-dependent oxidoreductase [Roseococcus sp. SDR]|uniref:type I polyketide synthase n=1 Tax=Roseococcus sp. SDR TaxID=2835532 RepID=UPI001BCF4D7E|nr:type I polyketide synthase [Roseococcus sp. SDR]MBS7791179.1 SDR family NAD(P)-dependent oxidoreductase [Roseococcus sp. SDR]MBV1846493.1 SDR family NAD(P)-dependent oxidoreductase [Roseococcus sp. SDR]
MILNFPVPLDILGLAVRLPGAGDLRALWSLLEAGGSAVRDISPADRWRPERFLSPDTTARGTAYTFAGGYLEDGLFFDAAAFGMSRREAEQMDPQQRVMLEVTWEALEDAGIAPSSLAGKQVGVFLGASATDYADVPLLDVCALDAHFMTGNSLALVSNRISYAYDLKGPSLTLDTACSSSVVALAQAAAALEAGRIELAIVGGVNMLSSPAPFIGFSRAGMLSPTGRCRPFSAKGDGYVRAEGAVALVLARPRSGLGSAWGAAAPRATLHAIGVNSDGRTNGISLPSVAGQRDLLEAIYRQAGISPDALAFVEAHGTGTRVGDPIEARAIGEALGRHRSAPLPVGSVKSNIGHLESASGMAGLAKLVLSLKHRRYPKTLYLEELNPDIDVAGLGLAPAAGMVELAAEGPLLAGLCNYGFGGTNAHAVIGTAPAATPAPAAAAAAAARYLVISAHSKAALRELAAAYVEPVEQLGAAAVAAAAQVGRDRLPHRLVLDLAQGGAVAPALMEPETPRPDVALGEAIARQARVAFVFSGNGTQWPGMGRAAYAGNAHFRAAFDEWAARIRAAGGICPLETMLAEDVAQRIAATSAMQPLLMAIQLSLCAALAAEGLRPDVVLGHSVGEVAAAAASGALTPEDAARLIVVRSAGQEAVQGLGGMAVLACDAARAAEIIAEAGAEAGTGEVEIAARNAPGSTTLSGTGRGLAEVLRTARRARIASVTLDVAYPFHSRILDPGREETVAALAGLTPGPTRVPMISAVTGSEVAGTALDGAYWWSNIRAPVLFQDAVTTALERAELFIEIGPRPILGALVADVARHAGMRAAAMATLTQARGPEEADPIARILLEAVVRGAPLATPEPAPQSTPQSTPSAAASPAPGVRDLPLMRWDRQEYVISATPEAYGIYGPSHGGGPLHPLIGVRVAPIGAEWRQILSVPTQPFLAGHRVDGQVILPATAYMEMMVAVGREVHGTSRLRILDLDILRALSLDQPQEVSILWHEAERVVEIRARPRLDAGAGFTLHARGTVLPETAAQPHPRPLPPVLASGGGATHDATAIYAATAACRLGYGGAFQVATGARVAEQTVITEIAGVAPDLGFFADTLVFEPGSYDAAFHGIFLGIPQKPGQVLGELPVRIGRLSLFTPGEPVTRSVARLVRQAADARVFDIELLSAEGRLVGRGEGVVMRRVTFAAWREADRIIEQRLQPWRAGPVELCAAMAEALDQPIPMPDTSARAALIGLALEIAGHVVSRVEEGRTSERSPDLMGPIAPPARVIWRALTEARQEAEQMAGGDAAPVLPGRLAGQPAAPASPLVSPLGAALAGFAARHPGASADLRLALHALEALPAILATGQDAPPNADLLDAAESASVFAAPSLDALATVVGRLAAPGEGGRLRLLLLEPGLAGLLPRLLPRLRAGEISLAILAADVEAAERLLARAGAARAVPVLGPETPPGGAVFDLALCAAVMPLDGGQPSPLDLLTGLGDAAPPLLVAIPPHHPAIDVLHAATPGWFRFSPSPEQPVGVWPYPSEVDEALTQHGFVPLLQASFPGSAERLVFAQPPHRPTEAEPPLHRTLALLGEETGFADHLPGFALQPIVTAAEAAAWVAAVPAAEGPAVLIETGPATAPDEAAALSARMLRLRELAIALSEGEATARLYVALEQGADGLPTPMSQAMAGYARCLMNEFPAVETCLLAWTPDAAPEAVRAALQRHIAEPLLERELRLTAGGVLVPRATRRMEARARALAEGERSLLGIGPRGLDDFAWAAGPRLAPAPGEVEVAVTATGLNFRDVMLGLGVLDSEILGEGLTSGSLGFEFAGHVLRAGEGVEGLEPGDPVMGFGAQAFASHLTLPADRLFPLGQVLAEEAAAAVPVAFVTAWFGLIERAGLKRGETVLIEGAAGGVGMAAVQIAKAHGAIVVAAAGTAEKRALLRHLGADHVVDSRATDVEDRIRAAVGGVDVVLNSVAGDAMRAALRLVKPFGRFVELGKRDFYDNTRLGLRPFVRNITYIGADIDQLLAHDPAAVRRMVSVIMVMFETGRLRPIPYLAFEGGRVGDAFRLMQASGHLGKILVRPASVALPPTPEAAPFRPAPGVHVVLGGTGGFGLETALWLAAQGAGTVVAVSRRGAVEEAMAPRVARARAAGTDLRVEALDITDAAAVAAAFARWRTELGPIAGVIHCAMVLEDGMILGLTPEKIARVLGPKVTGMRALEAAIAGDALQYLVAYSSSTTFVGSPGQSSYVVGNAFLEGAMLGLRARGVPALAVCWGAISDVGVIARTRGLAERLRAATGVSGVTSAEALHHLGTLLADPAAAPPVSAYSVIRWSPAANKLAVLRSPYFADVFAEQGLAGAGGGPKGGDEVLDLSALSPEAATEALLGLMREEVARILRLPPEAVEPDRPLIDIGLDSLMALELRLGVEKRTGVELPLTTMGGNRSIRDLVGRIVGTLSAQRSQ